MSKVVLIADEPVVLIADELGAVHDCPLCALPFEGYGIVRDKDLRWLRDACAEIQATEEHARQRLERADRPGTREVTRLRLRREARAALAAADRTRANMRDRITGREPKPSMDLWGSA